MPESQTTNATDQTRGRGETAAGAPAEPRSFQDGPRQAARTIEAATQPMIDGGRQMAETGRRAARQMTDAWRQALDPLLAMQYDVSQVFDEVFRQTFGFRTAQSANPLRPLAHLSAVSLFGLPPTDLKETEEAHLLAIELPGLRREDVDLSVVGDTLVICGHKAEETDDATATYRVSERRYGRFERAFPLPPDVDRGRIEARFADGLLRITLPKQQGAAPARSRIEIKG